MCLEDIREGAKKCIRCSSSQGWLRHFSASHVVLSLLVALLSVASVAVPAVIKVFTPENSRLALRYMSSDSNLVTILAFNSGIRPGVVTGATIVLEGVAHGVELRDGPSIIEAGGAKRLVLGVGAVSNYYYAALDIPSSASGHPSGSSSCKLGIHAVEFDGARKVTSVVRPCQELLQQVNR